MNWADATSLKIIGTLSEKHTINVNRRNINPPP